MWLGCSSQSREVTGGTYDTKGSSDAVELCLKDKELSREELIKKLASIDYKYDAELNQFV